MTSSPIAVRVARPEDAAELLSIYSWYVENTTVTFEYDVPTVSEFEGRIRRTLRRYPYLVAERDGEILGYAYAGPFRERVAYAWCCEASVYIRRDMHRLGIGRMLYQQLEEYLRAQNVASMDACISHPNKESIKFHSSLDFERVARFSKCAFKMGRWVDVVWMQKILQESDAAPAPFRPFPEICPEAEITDRA